MPPVALALAAGQGIYQGVKGLVQKRQAKKLKESTFIPEELLMNRDLAMQQAYSRRAPGQSNAEENVRRTMANRIAGAQRSFSGDANKIAAVTSAASGQANDANARIAEGGARFSENAIGRLSNANTAIAGQKRQNRAEYLDTKAALDASGDQNIFNSIGNIASAGIAGMEAGAFDGIDSETRQGANALIKAGRATKGSPTPGMGLSLINEGRGMKQAARRNLAKSQRGGWNDYLMQNRRGQVYDRFGNPIN
jgi:hypothetical protein